MSSEGQNQTISQKEYLKKYLSGAKKKKKKQKISSSSIQKRSRIIDDDLGLNTVACADDEEFNFDYLGDEAPQIAGVIDERPQTHLWKSIGETENSNRKEENISKEGNGSDASFLRKHTGVRSEEKRENDRPNVRQDDSDSDASLPRKPTEKRSLPKSWKEELRKDVLKKEVEQEDSDVSLPRKQNRHNREFHKTKREESPTLFRKNGYGKFKQDDSDSDVSLPRKHSGRNDRGTRSRSEDYKKLKREDSRYDSDTSPPRKQNKSSREFSAKYEFKEWQKKSKYELKSYKETSYHFESRRESEYDYHGNDENKHKHKNNSGFSSKKWNSKDKQDSRRDSRESDWHKRRHDQDDQRKDKSHRSINLPKARSSSSDRGKNRKENNQRDMTPPRKQTEDRRKETRYDSDESPPRRHKSGKIEIEEGSSRRSKKESRSPQRIREKRSPYGEFEKSSKRYDKMEKTLDGKRAGLQNAKNLKEELDSLKQKEENMFKQMSATVSGEGAVPIMRDRKTGKKRDLEKEKEEERKNANKQAVRNEKYMKWGKGLKQVEDSEKRLTEVLHEMSKPLARYADDTDLDNMLKAREREGDPMLEYIRQKQTESIDVTEPNKPKYKGIYMPNRFGIPPGYRWDGVDRSNGYEKEWFQQRNAKKAVEEEAYKWSTSDM